MSEQEQWIAAAFVEIADHLVEEFDLIELLSTLAERCAEFVDASDVGFLIADANGILQVVGASSKTMEALELFELQNSEGPCWECFHTGQPVINQERDAMVEKWPTFGPVLAAAGFETAHALPMKLRSEVIGAVNLFHAEKRLLSSNEAAILQAFADAASIAIVQERALRHATQLAEQLQHALQARVVIEQAKGVLSERMQVEMNEAFELLRKYSRDHNRHLSDVAFEVAEGRLPAVTFEPLRESLRK